MRMHAFHRTELLLGREGFRGVTSARACVIGLGGVGGHAAEALARSGVGHLTLVDFDRVCLTNLNRQVQALRSTVGQSKAELMGARVRDINPECDVRVMREFYQAESADRILDGGYDLVLDCVDNMSAKLHLLRTCVERGIPVFSSMGAGGRMDPTRVRAGLLRDTRNDPFAKIVRHELRAAGVEADITVVWSDELPQDLDAEVEAGFRCICPDRAGSPNSCDRRLQVQGTVPWMPPAFGLALAAAAVHHLIGLPFGGRLSEVEQRRLKRQRPSPGKPAREHKRALLRQVVAAGLASPPNDNIGPASDNGVESEGGR